MSTQLLASNIVVCFLVASVSAAHTSDALRLRTAKVVLESRHPVVENAARVLVEEIAKRSGLIWEVGATAPAKGARIVLAVGTDDDAVAAAADGFRLSIDPNLPAVRILGADPRGVLYGVGHLLRKCAWRRGSVDVPWTAAIQTSPRYPLRGHQLGYRHRANTYDRWDAAQYEQYIRELAIFGANSIENIPTEGGRASDHMVMSRQEMNTRLSEICDRYGLDFWMWIPANFELTDAARRATGLAEHEEIYRSCPRVDHIFFPGGDPGDNHPREVMPYLVDVAAILKRHHPDAMVWLSMQGFGNDEVDYVFEWLEKHDPRDWFAGLVAGPGSPPIPQTRARLARHFGLRHYPDINHVVRCQYPVSYWDPAYARTHTREPVNVRPRFQQFIHNALAPYTVGFLAYSDGTHDDVNKAVWSQLGWNPDTGLRDILEDYARFFLGGGDAPELADMLLALERNWEGPLDTNGSVSVVASGWETAFRKHAASDAARSAGARAQNWRWQMFTLRAKLDAYTRLRLLHENKLEALANSALLANLDRGSAAAIAAARAILARADTPPAQIAKLRDTIVDLGEKLWQSIGFQMSVKKYGAAAGHRGAVLDYLDVPLNDRRWLEAEFEKLRALPDETDRIARLRELATWETPGEGSFYDDLGTIGRSPHVVFPDGENTLPGLRRRPSPTYWKDRGVSSRLRQAWLVTLRWPHTLRYRGLEKNTSYTLRLTGRGEARPCAGGVPLKPGRYGTEEGAIKEFAIPPSLIQDGTLEITFDDLDEKNLNWRVRSRLAEAWLIREPISTTGREE